MGLAEAEARYRSLIEQIPGVAYTAKTGRDGRWLYVAPQVEELLGYAADEWCADPSLWRRTIHVEDREQVLALERERTPDIGTRDWAVYRMVRRDGTSVWIRDNATLVEDPVHGTLWHGVLFDITDLVEAEQARFAIESRYRTLVEHVPAVVYEADTGEAGSWRFVSSQIERLVGYTAQEWCADPNLWRDRLHPADRDEVLAREADGTTTGDEYRLRRRDGSVVWVRDEATLARDEDGTRYWRGLMIDISERKRAEADLREAEAHYRTVIESLREGVVMRVRDGDVVAVNESACRISGLTRRQWRGEDPVPDDWIAVAEDGSELDLIDTPGLLAMRTKEVTEAVIGMGRRNGQIRWVAMHARPLFLDGETHPYAAVTSFEEVTERIEARRRDQLLAMVVDSSEEAVFTTDLDTVITSWNPAAESLFGYAAEEAIGMPADVLIPADRAVEKDRIIEEALANDVARLQTRREAKDGRIVDVAVQFRPIVGDRGEPVGFASITRDLTRDARR